MTKPRSLVYATNLLWAAYATLIASATGNWLIGQLSTEKYGNIVLVLSFLVGMNIRIRNGGNVARYALGLIYAVLFAASFSNPGLLATFFGDTAGGPIGLMLLTALLLMHHKSCSVFFGETQEHLRVRR